MDSFVNSIIGGVVVAAVTCGAHALMSMFTERAKNIRNARQVLYSLLPALQTWSSLLCDDINNTNACMFACASVLAWDRVLSDRIFQHLTHDKIRRLHIMTPTNSRALEECVRLLCAEIKQAWNLKTYDVLLLTSVLLPMGIEKPEEIHNVWNTALFEQRLEEYSLLRDMRKRWKTPEEKHIKRLKRNICRLHDILGSECPYV